MKIKNILKLKRMNMIQKMMMNTRANRTQKNSEYSQVETCTI